MTARGGVGDALRSTSPRTAAAIAVAGVAVLLASSLPPPSRLFSYPDRGDIALYFDYAQRTFEGQVPYRDFTVEYPPGFLAPLLAPGPVRETLPDAEQQSLVEKLIPDFLWISTEYTAKISLDGLERNKMRVVPGVTSKAMSVASGYTPRAIVTTIVGAVYKKLGGG